MANVSGRHTHTPTIYTIYFVNSLPFYLTCALLIIISMHDKLQSIHFGWDEKKENFCWVGRRRANVYTYTKQVSQVGWKGKLWQSTWAWTWSALRFSRLGLSHLDTNRHSSFSFSLSKQLRPAWNHNLINVWMTFILLFYQSESSLTRLNKEIKTRCHADAAEWVWKVSRVALPCMGNENDVKIFGYFHNLDKLERVFFAAAAALPLWWDSCAWDDYHRNFHVVHRASLCWL